MKEGYKYGFSHVSVYCSFCLDSCNSPRATLLAHTRARTLTWLLCHCSSELKIRPSVFTCKWCSHRGEGGRIVSRSSSEELCWGFGQWSPYQMKSRPLREGGVGEGQGLCGVEGANRRIEQLAESRVQPQKHTEARHTEHGGNLLS